MATLPPINISIGGTKKDILGNDIFTFNPIWYAAISDLGVSAAGGDLIGTFPNPIVAKINGVSLGSTLATAGNLLIGSGSQWVTQTMSGGATISSTGVVTLNAITSGTIADNAVTFAKMQDISTATIIGRTTAGTGDPEQLTAIPFTVTTITGGTGLTSYTQGDIIYASASNVLSSLAKDTNSTRYLSNQGTSNSPSWNQVNLVNGVTGILPTANGGVADGDKGDITVSSSGTVWTVDNTTITYAKIQNISATARLLGRTTAGAGSAEELTAIPFTVSTTTGGTGLTSYTQGDLIYSSASNTLSALAKDTNSTRYLSNQGTSNSPSWNQVNLANGVTGTLPTGNGGTGVTISPCFYANRITSNQTGVASATYTKVQLNNTTFDNNSNFDKVTNYRFTPTVAGKYVLAATISWATGSILANTLLVTAIYKNGAGAAYNFINANTVSEQANSVSVVLDMNGSTDYIELYGLCVTGTTGTIETTYTTMSGARVCT